MSLLVNNTLANPTTSFYAALGSGGGGGGGNTLDSPASIVPSPLDGSASLVVAAQALVAANANVNVTGSGSGTGSVNVSSAGGPAAVNVTGVTNAALNVLSPGNTTIEAHTTGAGATASLIALSNGPAAVNVTSGGASAATVSVNAAGTGAAVVGVVGTAGPATLNVEANGAGAATVNVNSDGTGSANMNVVAAAGNTIVNLSSSTGIVELNIIGGDSIIQLGGVVGGATTPGFCNNGDGVIRVTNALGVPNDPSEVLTADVLNNTLKVKGLGGAPQVLLASQNIAPGNVTPTTFTIPNPTGEGLYSIMAASSTVGGPSTQNSRDAQFSMMAYVNSAGRIQIGGNGGTTVGAVGGGQSLEIYPLDGTTNLFMTYNGTQQLNNMSVVAFNISGPIPSAF